MDQLKHEDMKNSIDSLLSTLKCPVCLELLEKDSILCINGHAICSKCKRSQGNCPTCRDTFSNLKQNNIFRQVLENVPHICRYEKCSSLVKCGDDHETFCRYRPTLCKYPNCSWVGSVDNIAYHLEDSHPGEKVLSAAKSVVRISKIGMNSGVTRLFSLGNHYFWQLVNHNGRSVSGSSVLVSFIYHPLFVGKPTRDIYLRVWFRSEENEYDVGIKIRMNQTQDVARAYYFDIPETIVSNFYNGDELRYHIFITDERSDAINMLLE